MGLVGLVHIRKVCSYYLSWKLSKAMMYRMVGLRFLWRAKKELGTHPICHDDRVSGNAILNA